MSTLPKISGSAFRIRSCNNNCLGLDCGGSIWKRALENCQKYLAVKPSAFDCQRKALSFFGHFEKNQQNFTKSLENLRV